MVIGCKNIGLKADRMPDGRGTFYLFFVFWYRKSRKSLGYKYGSLRWF